MPELARAGERVLRGIPVSPGVSRGKVIVLTRQSDKVPEQHLPEDQVAAEVRRFEQALIDTRRDIAVMQEEVNARLGAQEASIFDAHMLVLEDPMLIEEVTRRIVGERLTAEFAFQQVADRFIQAFGGMADEYLRERSADLRDVAQRVLHNLTGSEDHPDTYRITEPCIIISHDLTPSQTAQLDKRLVLGFATDVGSKTSHTAIMARSLRIPAVVGLPGATKMLENGQYILLDGFNGVVVVNPTDQTLFEYGQLVRRQVTLEEKLAETRNQAAVTLDGVRIILSANIEQPGDSDAVTQSGAEGVGLFRTEYLFINRDVLPDEEEQFQAYRQVAAALKPQPVIIRTLDLGGDKFLSHLQVPEEMNPFLGWRAIRFCLQEKDIFRSQLRAILRASAEGNVRMMYPMISCADEVDQANALVEECKKELRKEKTPFNDSLEIGVMVEIPSAALAAGSLARKVKFFSVGTNDLIQYTLAVDRLNEKIAHLYEPAHPAILRLIQMTVEAARQEGIWVGVCGEMAADPILVPLLLGLGVEELSVAPLSVPKIKYLIRRIKMSEAKELAQCALKCDSPLEITTNCLTYVKKVAASLFEK